MLFLRLSYAFLHVKFPVFRTVLQQFLMRSFRNNAAARQEKDPLASNHCGEAVRHHDDSAFSVLGLNRILYLCLRYIIKRGGRFIQHDHRIIFQHAPCQGDHTQQRTGYQRGAGTA